MNSVSKKVVRRAKSLHRSSHRSVLFLALLTATSQRSVPFFALLGADVWWRCCCCCWFVLPRCDAEWVRFFVAPLNGIRNFLSAKRRFEGGSNVVDVDDASKIWGKNSVKKSGKNVGQKIGGKKSVKNLGKICQKKKSVEISVTKKIGKKRPQKNRSDETSRKNGWSKYVSAFSA